MDEKMKLYKSSSQYKVKVALNIFLVVLFLAIVAAGYYFYKTYNVPNVPYDENKNYYYEFNNNTITLYSEAGVEGTYSCSVTCEIYKGSLDEEYYYRGMILIKEEENIFLYDLLNNKKTSRNYNRIEYILDGKGNKITNVKFLKVNDSLGKQGIIYPNGNIFVDLIYDEIGKSLDETFINYSYSKMYITARKDGKWGLISLNNGKTLINFQYDDMRLSAYNKLAVKETNFWFVIDENNKKVIPTGYASLDIFENNFVVSENKQVFILDNIGNVVSNKIDLYYDVDPWAIITKHGLESRIIDGKIHLMVDVPTNTAAGNYKTVTYYYDEDSKQIMLVS